ncbi:hypothetical protein D3C83_12640 [compost metagenome]
MPLRHHLEIEPAGIFGGGANGVVEIEFLGIAFTREFAQPPQRHLDVAGADLDRVVEIAEFALVPHLDRAAMARLVLPDAYAFRVVTIGTERRSAGSADPLAAALMPALLLFEPFFKRLHELVPATQRLDLLLLLLGQ